LGKGVAGRRSRAETARGTVTRARRPRGPLGRLHLPATLLAAAPYQVVRGRGGPGLALRRDDLREARREGREGNLVLFVVDASGSMAARARMAAVKGAVLSLLLDAYQRRDRVGLVTFAGDGATVVLPPTTSAEAAVPRLTALATGGRTPVAAGLLRAGEVLRVERLRDPLRRPLLVLVTDGRATGPPGTDPIGAARRAARLLAATVTAAVVVDCESGPVRLGLAGDLAAALGGVWLRLEQLRADTLAGSIRALRGGACPPARPAPPAVSPREDTRGRRFHSMEEA
jgi:magnesium chelatase subunit D